MAVGELRRSRICEDSQAVMDVRGAMIAVQQTTDVRSRRRGMVVLPRWWLCSGYTGLVGEVFSPQRAQRTQRGRQSGRGGEEHAGDFVASIAPGVEL